MGFHYSLLTLGNLPGTVFALLILFSMTVSLQAGLAEEMNISRVTLPVNVEDRARCVSLPEDGRLIAFTSQRAGGHGENDIWMCRRKDGQWSAPFNPGPAINSGKNEFDGRFSRDGRSLVFVRGEIDMWKANSSRIQVAHYQNGRWSPALAFPDHVSPPNTVELAASLSSDGDKLYFSSNRAGGFGKYDHYYCEHGETGWSKPVNLGPEVNTEEDEIDMTLGANGDVLIFPAHREDSIGGSHDLYLSRKCDGQWAQPVNLGPRINTPGNDTCPWLAYDGFTLYVDSDWEGLTEGTKGNRLIWRFWYSDGF